MNGSGPGPEDIAHLVLAVQLFWVAVAIALAALVMWLTHHPRQWPAVAIGAAAAVSLALLSGATWPL